MSPREVADRAYRLLKTQVQSAAAPLGSMPVPAPRENGSQSFVRVPERVDVAAYAAAADRILGGETELLFKVARGSVPPHWNRNPVSGEDVPLRFGKHLDYRDTGRVGDIKYLWLLNRHHQTLRLAQAYALTRKERYLEGVRSMIESWLIGCPYPLGPNWASSLELAIRLLNWSAVWFLIDGDRSPVFSGNGGADLKRLWLESIYRHQAFIAGHLSRGSSANNHLIGEAAGLYVAAVAWPRWSRSRSWQTKGREILEAETLKQVTSDGVDREHSIFYQNFVLEFLLAAGIAGEVNGDEFSDVYWIRVEQMLCFVAALMDAGGALPAIGDSDDALVLPLEHPRPRAAHDVTLRIGRRLFGREDLTLKLPADQTDVAWLKVPELGSRRQRSQAYRPPLPTAFPEGGYYQLGRDLGTPREVRILANASSLGYPSIAAHGHADALAFVLGVAGRPVFIDPGTYAYQTDPDWRDYFRGTAAHNTVRVDGLDQAEIGGKFLWTTSYATQCLSWHSDDCCDRIIARHDGYARLSDPLLHTRELRFDKASSTLTIIDELDCRGEHEIERFWHLAPDLDVTLESKSAAIRGSDVQVLLTCPDAQAVSSHRGEESPVVGWVSPRFGEKEPTSSLRFVNQIQGPTKLHSTIRIHLKDGPDAHVSGSA